MEAPYTYWGPSGIEAPQIGNPIAVVLGAEVITPTHRVHHITGRGIISTINPPWADFVGPIILIADGEFGWDDSGNITTSFTPAVIGEAYPFYYDRQIGKWYPRIATVGENFTISGFVSDQVPENGGESFVGAEVYLTIDAIPWPGGPAIADANEFYSFAMGGAAAGTAEVTCNHLGYTGTNAGSYTAAASLSLDILMTGA